MCTSVVTWGAMEVVCSVKYMAILKFPNFIQMELILNWNRS